MSRTRRPAPLEAVTRAFVRTHAAVLRGSGGRVGGRYLGADVCLLTVTGRRTGRSYDVPLICVRDGADLVVATVNGGLDAEPQWWLNLRARPEATVSLGGRSWPVRASAVTGGEREELWRRLAAVYRGYETYQRRLTRRMTVVRLAPSRPI